MAIGAWPIPATCASTRTKTAASSRPPRCIRPRRKALVRQIYLAWRENLLKLSDEQLAPTGGDKLRKRFTSWQPFELGCFGVENYPLPPRRGDQLSTFAGAAPAGNSLQVPIDLSPYANDRFPAAVGPSPIEAGPIEAGRIDFRPLRGTQNQVNLRPVQWIGWRHDGSPQYTEPYDEGAPVAFDPRMPLLRVPTADYIAAHVLAVADDDPEADLDADAAAGELRRRQRPGRAVRLRRRRAAAQPTGVARPRTGRDHARRTPGPRRGAHVAGHRPGPLPAAPAWR